MLRPFHPRSGRPTRTTRPMPSLLTGHVLLRLLPVAGLLAWQLLVAQPAQARAGALDPSFGSGGMVTTDFGGSDGARALAVQADGKLVATGRTINAGAYDFALARYKANGSLDASFGAGGKVTTGFAGASEDGARAVAVQADGKPVAAGSAATGGPGGAHGFALARYNSNGSLDASFGTGGKVITDFAGGSDDGAAAVVVQADGKLVAAGTTLNLQTLDLDFALARYNLNGSLDPTFGSGGKVTTDFPGGYDKINALVVQADGKLVAVGSTDTGENAFALARYNPDGSLDQSFGTGGTVTTHLGGPDGDYGYAVAVQADGKLVAAGWADIGEDDFGVARYNPDGSLDQSFGTGGTVTTDFGGTDRAFAVAVQADGKPVAAGYTTASPSTSIALVRYNPNGSLDPRFGAGGKVTTGGLVAFALAVQGSKLVAAGGGGGDFVLARYRTR